jgi:hypothetical protein
MSRAHPGQQVLSDFESLSEVLVAIEAAYPEVGHIRCYEWSVDYEYPNEMTPCLDRGKNGRPVRLPSRAALRHNSLGRLVGSLCGQNPGGRSLFTGQGGFHLIVSPVCRPIWSLGIYCPGTVARGPASLESAKGRGSSASKRQPPWVATCRFCHPTTIVKVLDGPASP